MEEDGLKQDSAQINETVVMYRQVAQVGSRVKHYGQRWTGCATATVIGFRDIGEGKPWIKVQVKPDNPSDMYGTEWDWDRTQIAPDIG